MPLPHQLALTPRALVLLPYRQVAHRQSRQVVALTPREIVLFPLIQVLPRQKMLMPRQSVPLPKQSASTNYQGVSAASPQAVNNGTNPQGVSATFPQVTQPSSEVNNANRSPSDNSLKDLSLKWVINLSSKPLTQAQGSLLAKGSNFVVTPRHPPNLEYMTAIEAVCTKLSQLDAEEPRAEINRILRFSHPPKSNSMKAQSQAIRELKRDRDHTALTADKRVAMVIMDRQDNINKANNLLN